MNEPAASKQRWSRRLAFAAFASQFVLVDLICSGGSAYVAAPRLVLLALGSAALWALLALLARRTAARVLVALVAGWLLVTQIVFFRYYHVFLGDDATACARYMWPDVKAVVVRILPWAALAAACVAAFEFVLMRAAAPARRSTTIALSALVLISIALAPAPRDAPPDLAALWSLRLLLKPHEARAAAQVEVPKLPSSRRALPNVLFVLSESVRDQDYSSERVRRVASEALELLPDRVELHQMRSLGSYTAVAVNALLSGRMPLGSRERIAATPLLFDYLRSVRAADSRPTVAYWSAQGDTFYARRDLPSSVDSIAFVDDVVGRPVESLDEVVELGVDRMLAARIEHDVARLKRPVFVLSHLSGTHAPYFVDPAHAPFVPFRHTVTWESLEELHNAYLDAIVDQDRSVARMVRAFLSSVGAEPWVVVFTSDHGEAFGEHKAIHHGQNLYDEQIHVPAFIAFGNGALDAAQQAALRSHANDFLTHLDLLPTLLDLYGVLDAFGMLPQRHELIGRSLLRRFDSSDPVVPATNCTELFPCPLRNWGMLGKGHLLAAQAWDGRFRCLDLMTNEERSEASDPICRELRQGSRLHYETLPNGRPNR